LWGACGFIHVFVGALTPASKVLESHHVKKVSVLWGYQAVRRRAGEASDHSDYPEQPQLQAFCYTMSVRF
ncbi:unnamed protein product, partial [Brassica rapa]